MDIIYVNQDMATLRRRCEHLELYRRGRKIASLPILDAKCLVLLNHTQITSPALELLFDRGVDVIYTSKSGRIKSKMLSQKGGGAIVRLAQYQLFTDKERRNAVASAIVNAKLLNQAAVLKRNVKKYGSLFDRTAIETLQYYAQESRKQNEISEIMGYEGIGAKCYWEQYRKLIGEESFVRREYRPARDHVNSLLNLGYAFLSNAIGVCLVTERLDLEIGFLHSILYGRNSLALDLMEEFRPEFVDAWVLKMIRLKILTADDFVVTEEGHLLNEKGFQTFVEQYHKHFEEGKWQNKFREQSRKLTEAILHRIPYRPYLSGL